MIRIDIQKNSSSKISSIDFNNLGFGEFFTDHLFQANYENDDWITPVIKPMDKIAIHPGNSTLHYGQAIFEGLKAYRKANNDIQLFRPEKNIDRFNKSATRLCMPQVPKDLFLSAIKSLVDLERKWVPERKYGSLYIRPFMFANEAFLGVRPAEKYTMIIILSPVGSYYNKPLNVKVERNFTRAVRGGIGSAKAAANYAASLYPMQQAKKQGYDQLIWTDGQNHNNVEELGTANFFAVIDNKLCTPKASDSILEGVTRDSIIQLARHLGIEVDDNGVSVTQMEEAYRTGSLTECFSTGTAAVISSIVSIDFDNFKAEFNTNFPIAGLLKNTLMDIQFGSNKDIFNWTVKV